MKNLLTFAAEIITIRGRIGDKQGVSAQMGHLFLT